MMMLRKTLLCIQKYLPVLPDGFCSFDHSQLHRSLSLKDVSFSVGQGESVGLIGSTGAGKSTLVDIILDLLVPVNGVVMVDGVDIQTNLRDWQDRKGYVPQSIFLTDDTIRRNVAFGLSDEKVEDKIIWECLNSAQLEQFVKDLPEDLDTRIGEDGVRLSGGQRVGIARALYYNPSVLVLDEATCSLDTITEGDFMDAIYALKGDKTLIIVPTD
jgi:ATP-binding cassette, subfamily B, bacterial PglK